MSTFLSSDGAEAHVPQASLTQHRAPEAIRTTVDFVCQEFCSLSMSVPDHDALPGILRVSHRNGGREFSTSWRIREPDGRAAVLDSMVCSRAITEHSEAWGLCGAEIRQVDLTGPEQLASPPSTALPHCSWWTRVSVPI
jgi:hypothetical protein